MQIGTLILLTFSILPIFYRFFWIFDLLVNFRVQYLVVSVFSITFFLFIKNRNFLIIATLTFLINVLFITPYLLPHHPVEQNIKTRSENSVPLKIFHSNVLSSNTNYRGLMDQIENIHPDIILLQEINEHWISNISRIRDHYPFNIEIPREDNFGIALYSKHPVLNHAINHWGGFDIPSIEATLNINNVQFTLIATHPLPPINKRYYESRNRQLASAAARAKEIHHATIILGDMNVTPWSAHYRILEKDTGLRNVSSGAIFLPTWPAALLPMMIPIDHGLVSSHFTIKDARTGDNFGSDHLPLIIDLEL